MNAALGTAARLHRGNKGSYALAYGSHAAGTAHKASDLDLLYTGVDPLPVADLERLVRDVKVLHAEHGLDLDEEVSYEAKLYATADEVGQATALRGFEGIKRDFSTPVGDSVYLNSSIFKLRLILNVLTTPHVFLAGDIRIYRRHAAAAERACALLALRLVNYREAHVEEACRRNLKSGPVPVSQS